MGIREDDIPDLHHLEKYVFSSDGGEADEVKEVRKGGELEESGTRPCGRAKHFCWLKSGLQRGKDVTVDAGTKLCDFLLMGG